MKIRTKLLVTFLSAIVLPVIMTLSLFYVYFSYKTKDEKFNRNDINKSTIELSGVISSLSLNSVNSHNFDLEVKSQLKPYNSIIDFIEICDLNGMVIYNSKDKNRLSRNIDLRRLPAHSNDIFNFSFNEKDNDFYLRTIKPLVINGSVSGFILFKQNPYTLIEYAKQIAYPILWFGTGSIMLVIIFFSWLISRGIIVPLKELSEATKQIAKGNLDFKIIYKNEDELGNLCSAFDTMKDKLRESLKKQAEYENSRKELVASISHDLRTPLTSIKGYVEALRDGVIKDPEKFKKYFDVIYNKTDSMNKLIDDLFEYSRLDLNNIKMNKEAVECRAMIERIAENLRYDIEKEQINFSFNISFDTFTILADKLRIEEVINNLVSNALRYTRTFIEINAFIRDNDLCIAIVDNGCGIRDEEKNKVFERFYRGEKSRSAKYGGAGLGLAISKKIIEEHSGSIWVESQEGSGCTFIFTIPELKTNP